MGYPNNHVQHKRSGGLTFLKNINAGTRLPNNICTEAAIEVVRMNEVTERKECWEKNKCLDRS